MRNGISCWPCSLLNAEQLNLQRARVDFQAQGSMTGAEKRAPAKITRKYQSGTPNSPQEQTILGPRDRSYRRKLVTA